jgi:hypothetical protein
MSLLERPVSAPEQDIEALDEGERLQIPLCLLMIVYRSAVRGKPGSCLALS